MEYLPYILAASIATILTRFLPFWLFKKAHQSPILSHLQRTSTLLIMVVLLIFAFSGLDFSDTSRIIYAITALFSVIILELFTKNALLSIALPTIMYIVLLKI